MKTLWNTAGIINKAELDFRYLIGRGIDLLLSENRRISAKFTRMNVYMIYYSSIYIEGASVCGRQHIYICIVAHIVGQKYT